MDTSRSNSQPTGHIAVEGHAGVLVARIDGGPHALFDATIAQQLKELVDRADRDPDIHAVVFTGTHPDRFLSHSDVRWLQKGGTGFPPINTRVARLVAGTARLINRSPIVRRLAGMTRLKTLLQLDSFHATFLKKASQVAMTVPSARTPLASSILLWMRTDQPRQQGMDHWKGPHSKIISATPGMEEYRQIHLAESNPGLWPAISGVETVIPAERRIDGVAEVTFTSLLSPLRGRKQTRLAYNDEVDVFRRTLLYTGLPYSARWYDVAGPGEKVGARSLIYLRRRQGVKTGAFRTFLKHEVVPTLLKTGALRELRTQVFLPWIERLWDTPNVAHDNPTDQRFHASLILGFTDTDALRAFFGSAELATLSGKLPEVVSAVHAYEVTEAVTYVKDGKVLPHYQT